MRRRNRDERQVAEVNHAWLFQIAAFSEALFERRYR